MHYTASPPQDGANAVEAIARYQISTAAAGQTGAGQPFPALAYHLMVDASGDVYLCHDLETRCWHSAAVVRGVGRNQTHVAVCLIENGMPGSEQIKGAARAIVWCEQQLGRRLEIEGHGDAYQTTCPGPNWHAWKSTLLEEVTRLR